ncbi:MAG: [Fe-Fe] hydrogenase large subunit C-terminal domain-containing protein [Eubacteriales bacterium]
MNCYKCLRSCQVKAIAFKNEQAEIIEKDCILCGHCFLVCPQNAKYIDSDLEKVKELVHSDEKVYVSIAPSYVSYFNGVHLGQISRALKKLGIDHVEETAIGAERVSYEYARLMQQNKMKNIISSACPTSVLLVEKYYPDLIRYLAPCSSPMVAHAKMMREAYGDGIKIVFIGPCISKKYEAADDLAESTGIQAVLMFEDLEEWLLEEHIDLKEIDQSGAEPAQTQSRIYPAPGGILRTLGSGDANYKSISVDGVDRCRELLNSLRNDELSGYFIEMSACPGSCLGGPGIVSKKISILSAQDQVYKNVGTRLPGSQIPTSENSSADLNRLYFDRSQKRELPTEEEIETVLRKMGKTLKEKQLNCGSCGYSSCRDKAIAVCFGNADIKMCLPHMREKAESISNIVIDNTPHGIFLLDEEFKVLEYNSSAEKMFALKSNYAGKFAMEIFDCRALEKVKNTGIDLIDDQEYYPEANLYTEQTIIHVKENFMYLIIIKNITNEMQQQMQMEAMQEETVDIAQKVINKQMRVAQEIASLLGETTAETKLALTKLKKSILSGTRGGRV